MGVSHELDLAKEDATILIAPSCISNHKDLFTNQQKAEQRVLACYADTHATVERVRVATPPPPS
jgi:hypothetical protein